MRYLVLDVGGSAMKHAVADSDLRLSDKGRLPTSYTTHEEFVEAIGRVHDGIAGGVDGIAISTCGELDPFTGEMFSGGAFRFNAGTNLVSAVRARCGVPVTVDNDANCALLAERADGALVGCTDAAVLVLGTGIGGSLLLDGEIYRGSRFRAGNASFTKLDLTAPLGGPQVSTVVGTPALAADYRRRTGDGAVAGAYDVFERVAAGDGEAVAALDTFCSALAVFVFNVQLLLDLEVVAIGGGISARPELFEVLQRQLDAVFDTTPVALTRPELRACRHRNDANLLGALHHHLALTAAGAGVA